MHPKTRRRSDSPSLSPPGYREGPYPLGTILLDRYEVFGVTEGGFSLVLFVTDLHERRDYAVKMPNDPSADFASEVSFWLSLEPHPHIVKAHFVKQIDGRPALFLDYVEDALPSGPMNAPAANRLAHQLCLAMEFANRRGEVAHLDLKPANLLVDRSGALKVTDFGLAHRVRVTSGKFAKTDAATWQYAAPEIFNGEAGDSRSDIFSFGVIFYEMHTGRLPYPFEVSEEAEQAFAELSDFHAHGGIAAMAKDLYYTYPNKELGIILSGCLGHHRSERTESFAGVLDMMERGLGLRTPPASEAGLTQQEMFERAVALRRVGLHREALDRLNLLLTLHPREAIYWFEASRALRGSGQARHADEFEQRARTLDPSIDRIQGEGE